MGEREGKKGEGDRVEEEGICVHAKVRALYNRGATVLAFHRAERSRMTERGCGLAWPALAAELYMNGA